VGLWFWLDMDCALGEDDCPAVLLWAVELV
jgi:hypothetical protein